MDRELDELRGLGYYGIFSECCKIIHRWRCIFLKITLTFILLLSFIFLSGFEFTILLKRKVIHNNDTLDETIARSHNRIPKTLSMAWTEYILINAVYLTFVLVFSLLSTSAVVYSVACAFTGKDTTYKKVMRVVPKIWKRLMVTFLCNFSIMVIYNICAFAILFTLFWVAIRFDNNSVVFVMISLFLIYFIGFVRIVMIWQLASVVSVLEESSGFKAMAKSRALIKGRLVATLKMFIVNNFFLVGIPVWFAGFVMFNESIGIVGKVGFGILSLVLVSLLFLYGLVLQTFMYFVCKSYHKESIDKLALSDHLEAYDGGYVPLNPKDVQMGQA